MESQKLMVWDLIWLHQELALSIADIWSLISRSHSFVTPDSRFLGNTLDLTQRMFNMAMAA